MSIQTSPQIKRIRFTLWSIRSVSLRDIKNALLELIPLNQLGHFAPMMVECIRASKEDPNVYKYVHLLDMLLYNAIFSELLLQGGLLLQLYPKIVWYVHLQGRMAELEQIKKIRKYWVKRIQPTLFQELRQHTFTIYRVDVDSLWPQTTREVRRHYVDVLGMPAGQVAFFLTNVGKVERAATPFFRPTTSPKPSESGNPAPFARNITKQPTPNVAKRTLKEYQNSCSQGPDPSLFAVRKMQIQSNPSPIYVSTAKNYNKETNKGNALKAAPKQEEVVHKPKEERQHQVIIVKHEPFKIVPQAFWKKLQSLNQFECKECGTWFQTKQSLDQHTREHILTKSQDLKTKQAKKFQSEKPPKNNLLSTTEWAAQDLQPDAKCNLVVPVGNQATSKQQDCRLCLTPIKQSFVDDEWVYENAIKTTIVSCSSPTNNWERKDSIMHQDCAQLIRRNRQVETKFVSRAND